MLKLVPVVLALSSSLLFAQKGPKVDSQNLYQRVFLTVPMVGAGTYADPKRPLFAPKPSEIKPGDRSGIIAWHFEASDDGKTALVEYVFADRAGLTGALRTITAQPSVAAFERGKDSTASIESAFRLLKKDFDLNRFMVRVP